MQLIPFTAAGLWLTLAFSMQAAAPANDSFSNASVLTGTNLTVTGANLDATKEPAEPDHGANAGGKSVWWQWTAPGAGSVIVTTAGSSFDTLLAAYTGSSVPQLKATVAASNDDGIGIDTSVIGFDVGAGVTYHIAVDGYDRDTGAISLALAYSPAPLARPVNDDFVDRISLGGALVETRGANLFASLEPNEPNHPDAPGGASIWWTWTAPVTADVTIDTQGSNVDTHLGVFTGFSLGDLKLVAQNDDINENQPASRVTFRATANTRYEITVDGYDGEPGDIHLEIAVTQLVWLDAPRRLPDGSTKLTLTGVIGKRYALEASTDLHTWVRLDTALNANGALEFTDPPAAHAHRFYRAQEVP